MHGGRADERPTQRVDTCLSRAREAGLARLDAQLLLAQVLDVGRTWLLAHGEAPVDAGRAASFDALVQRRAAGEPVAYLLGRREFFGLELSVGPAVLDPRPDTEILVEWALATLQTLSHPSPTVVDLGTGSGAIALAIKSAEPQAQVLAVDRSPDALAVASANGDRLGLEVDWRLGDWFDPLAGLLVDLIVSNPPYLAETDPHLPALAHEPRSAFVAGEDGLADLRRLAAGAPSHLREGGWLLLEHGADQAAAVAACLAAAGFRAIAHRQDLAGHVRCTGGRWDGVDATASGTSGRRISVL